MKSKFKTVRLDHINPDGVVIAVDWDKFEVNTSVFIPAINTTHLIKEMHRIAKEKGMKLEDRVMIDGGKWGVRFWRMM